MMDNHRPPTRRHTSCGRGSWCCTAAAEAVHLGGQELGDLAGRRFHLDAVQWDAVRRPCVLHHSPVPQQRLCRLRFACFKPMHASTQATNPLAAVCLTQRPAVMLTMQTVQSPGTEAMVVQATSVNPHFRGHTPATHVLFQRPLHPRNTMRRVSTTLPKAVMSQQ